jgi:hypothetical protein
MGLCQLPRKPWLLLSVVTVCCLLLTAERSAASNAPPKNAAAGGATQSGSGGSELDKWIVPIIAALITGAATVIAARQKLRADDLAKRLDGLQAGIEKLGKGLPDNLVDRYGFTVQSNVMKVEMKNINGDAVMTRTWKAIAISREVSLTSIPVKAAIDSPKGKLLGDPRLTSAESNGRSFPKDVDLQVVKRTERSCEYLLTVAGALTRTDPPLDVRTDLDMQAGYVLSQSELATAYPNPTFRYEYVSLLVDIPTQVLEIDVRFPPGYQAQAFAGVFLWDSEFMHDGELQRIRGGLEHRDDGGATLRVENPLLGLSYLIYWKSKT